MFLVSQYACIAESILQKLKKVEQGLQEEQKVCDALKARHVAATAEQRRCYSLLKAFQVNTLIKASQIIDMLLTPNSTQYIRHFLSHINYFRY